VTGSRTATAFVALLFVSAACGDGTPTAATPEAAEAAPSTPYGVERFAAGTTHVADPANPPSREQIDVAIAKGVQYLVDSQNKDGSWGSPAPTLTVDIYAPGPGAFESYQVATSALAVAALVDSGLDGQATEAAVRRGTDYLLAHSRVPRASIDVLYNFWAHAYSLGAYARLLPKEQDPERRQAMEKACADCVDMLVRFEYLEGGWGYYDFNSHTRKPANHTTSFGTATGLVALRMAKDAGIEVPQRLVDRSMKLLTILRHPDNSFGYSWSHRFWPQGGINKIKGSLARTPACLKAIRDWGGPVSDAQVATAFENLRKEGRFLALARKYPRPHETFYQNSGYFTFYGYYYASLLLPVLDTERRQLEAGSMASYLLPLQEQDGSWWDYQLYRYHKPYGTAYVLMVLSRCR
jgi:hypothetical protein